MFWKKKKKKPGFKCSECGEYHEGWPSLGYDAPWNYHCLTEEQKEEIATLGSDFCEIKWEDETNRFIRTVMVIPVNDFEYDLEYGLWVSLSEKSFKDYKDNYDRTDYETGYFGWICNKISGYESTLSVPSDVILRPGTQRPYLRPHQSHDHQLVTDYFNGITKREAERRIHLVIDNSN